MDKKQYQSLFHLIEPEFRGEFDRFIKTGETSEKFMTYLDNSESAQEAVDICFREQAGALERLGQYLRANKCQE